METGILFEEVQSRTDKKTSDFFKVLSVIVLIALIVNIIFQRGRTNEWSYFLIIVLPVLVILSIILPFKLVTQIRTDGIYVRFPPLQPFFQKFYWKDVAEVYIRNYNALTDYFGWGIRYSPQGLGYIVRGDTGIQIVLKNGNKVLITTQRQEEVYEVLKRLGLL